MRPGKGRMLLLCAAVCGALLLPAAVSAAPGMLPCDVGNHNDYDDYGDYGDYGGNDDDDYGNDYGGYDGWGNDYDDNDYGGGSSSASPVTLVFAGVVVLLIVVAVSRQNRAKNNRTARSIARSTYRTRMNPPTPGNHDDEILAAIHSIDPAFSRDAFIGWAKEVFVILQQAWTARDWNPIRPFEKEELFRLHEAQLNEYIRLGRINIIERISVNQAYLHFYRRDAQYEYLTVYMAVRMGDYIIDEHTRAVLKGDPNREYSMHYLLTFTRRLGITTKEARGAACTYCPNCGAPMHITHAGQCEYCGSDITTGDFDWVLSNLDSVKPDTALNERGVLLPPEN